MSQTRIWPVTVANFIAPSLGNLGRILASWHHRLLGRPMFYRLHRYLYQLASRGMGIRNCNFVSSGELRVLERIVELSPLGWIVDAGAHDGAYSRAALALSPRLSILAVEPHPGSFARMEKKLSPQITMVRGALGRSSGDTQIFDRPGTNGSVWATTSGTALETLYHDDGELKKYSVARFTLDELCERHQIPRIALLKIDVEGDELEVLEGASRLLKSCAIDAIQFELSFYQALRGIHFADFRRQLPHFVFFRVLPAGLLSWDKIKNEDPEVLFMPQNCLAVRKDLAPLLENLLR